MAASRRKKIMMVSEGKNKKGKPTKYCYYMTIGEKAEKLKLRKYDPSAYNSETGKHGMHVFFNEKKVPK